MKKLLLSFIFIAILSSLSYAQNPSKDIILSKQANTMERLKDMVRGTTILDNFKVCEESFAWDTINDQFVGDGETVFTYEEIGNIKKFSAESTFIDEDGTTQLKVETYASFQMLDDPFLEVGGDSILMYLGDGNDNYELLSRQINHFENEILVLSEEFFDFSLFGLPLGMVKAGQVIYHYDGNDFLIAEVTDQIDFNTFQLEFSDSIVYENNNIGFPELETGYMADFLTGMVEPSYQTEYTYINQFYVETETTSSYIDGIWDISNRYTNYYDNENRRTGFLEERSNDNGENWMSASRLQSIYEEDLPLNIPDRELNQVYNNGEWVNEALRLYEDCTSNLETSNLLNFEVWFNEDVLWINAENREASTVQLFNLNGRMLYSNHFANLPEKISFMPLNRGIYVIKIMQDGQENVQKIFR